MKTRIFAMLLALVLVLGMTTSAVAAETAPALVLTATYGSGAVTVTVAVDDAEGLTNGKFSLGYDSALELISATAANAAVTSVNAGTAGKVEFAWVGSKLTEEATDLLVLVFQAAEANCLTFTVQATEAYAAGTPLSVAGTQTTLVINPFTDIDGHWAREEILSACHGGLFNGMTATTFGPDVKLTRGMFVTLLYRMEGSPVVDMSALCFDDVSVSAYYAAAVIWATEAGVTNGTSISTFSPGNVISRQELVTMLYRYATFCGEDLGVSADLTVFTDVDAISGWAVPAMGWAVAQGLVGGYPDGTIQPAAAATRAQTAAVLCRFAGRN